MAKSNFIKVLFAANTCRSGLSWALNFEGDLSQMWSQCERGDWMLWLLSHQTITNYKHLTFN